MTNPRTKHVLLRVRRPVKFSGCARMEMDALDIMKQTVQEARNSKFTVESERSFFRIQDTVFPLIQYSNGQTHTIDCLGSVGEEPIPSKRWLICRVPAHIREANERAYSPRIASVGPFHYKETSLEPMEAQKLRLLRHLLERNSHKTHMLGVLEDAMEELEGKTRECYSEDFKNVNSKEFTRMMLVDGCFVVELLHLSGKSYQGNLADDPIFATRWMPLNLGRDLLLLENQLPLFVLQKIFELTSSGEETPTLNKLALQFFEIMRPGKDMIPIEKLDDLDSTYPHLLALFQSSFAPNEYHHPSPAQKERSNNYNTFAGQGWIYNAKRLSYAGVRFKHKHSNLLDMEFKNKVLEIPTLFLDENTSTVLRNLVAYEQSDKSAAPYLTSLAFFFSNILGNPDDAAVLKKSGIIRQAQGGDIEVVIFFNSLAKELVFDMDKCYFREIIEDINTCSETKCAKLRSFCRPALSRLNKLEIVLFSISLLQTALVIVSLGS